MAVSQEIPHLEVGLQAGDTSASGKGLSSVPESANLPRVGSSQNFGEGIPLFLIEKLFDFLVGFRFKVQDLVLVRLSFRLYDNQSPQPALACIQGFHLRLLL